MRLNGVNIEISSSGTILLDKGSGRGDDRRHVQSLALPAEATATLRRALDLMGARHV